MTAHLQCVPKPEANYNAEGAELVSMYYIPGGVGGALLSMVSMAYPMKY